MAAVTELCFLLFALISNIHAGELITIKEEGDSYTFHLPEDANSCLISRFAGEEKLVLWNTSDLWSHNSIVPEDLKRRLSVISRENISSYIILNLTHSDSGPYQEECWTDGRVTHEKNIIIIICSTIKKMFPFSVMHEETVHLPCAGATDALDFQWLWRHKKEDQWSRVHEDNTTSAMDSVTGGFKVVNDKLLLNVSNITTAVMTVFNCLLMNQQQCVRSKPVQIDLEQETIYRSEGETAVLPCPATGFSDDQPPHWLSSNINFRQQNQTVSSVDKNYSLVFSSVTLNHSGVYRCETSMMKQRYILLVCPKFDPPAVELFSEGEDVTLSCKDFRQGMMYMWFIKTNQTGGRMISAVSSLSMSRVRRLPDERLMVSNVSLKDTGEYWCAVVTYDLKCVSTSKTLLTYREPFGIHSTFYTVRCSVLSALLVMLCVVVVAVNQRSKRGEQLSAQTHS
ncbi:hypothetical protein ABVT39_001909 [Epinephelus coioides]